MRTYYRDYLINSIKWADALVAPDGDYCSHCGSYYARDRQDFFFDVEDYTHRVVNMNRGFCSKVCATLEIDRLMARKNDNSTMEEETTE